MTRRMVAAVASPHVDVLGHCTGRLLVGRGRPESEFDDDVVIEACRRSTPRSRSTAVRSGSTRRKRILTQGGRAPGCGSRSAPTRTPTEQLEWQPYGTDRAAECGVTADRVVNAMPRRRAARVVRVAPDP